jgi:hypothetical protein
MKTEQGISLYSYLYLKQSKRSGFSLYLLSFFFYKTGKQEGRTDPAGVVGLALVGRGRWPQKRVGG